MNDDAKPAVKRRHHSGIHVAISLGRATDHALWCGLELDVTRGGVFVATHLPIGIGTQVELLLTLEGETTPIAASGVVRWTRDHKEGSDGAAGVGVRFVDLPGDATAKLVRFAAEVREPEMFDLEEPPMRARISGSMRVA